MAIGSTDKLVRDYLDLLNDDHRLFPFKNSRADQIVKTLIVGLAKHDEGNPIGVPPHWLRAYGENYIYEKWDRDIIAVAGYIQVDARTLTKHIHGTHAKYLDRET